MATLNEAAAVRDGQLCASCTAPWAFELCCGCGETCYCDTVCQKRHWQEGEHQLEYAELEAARQQAKKQATGAKGGETSC